MKETDATVVVEVREPLGVVVVIKPWNFPVLVTSWAVCEALAVGNVVIAKPS